MCGCYNFLSFKLFIASFYLFQPFHLLIIIKLRMHITCHVYITMHYITDLVDYKIIIITRYVVNLSIKRPGAIISKNNVCMYKFKILVFMKCKYFHRNIIHSYSVYCRLQIGCGLLKLNKWFISRKMKLELTRARLKKPEGHDPLRNSYI